ncbi:hypothetical protein [Puniceicoccus vermicola]|uniref:ATP-binding protein n=1 Tax=Puniceicoccus vermicola TaxID=388746 RepID=A0A7X1AUV1_9BACT|nr:hypothetical protein [Puniceicoccus vermicola]MBC2600436.1 hypothetical protein [Puniceicoccus vermicola]
MRPIKARENPFRSEKVATFRYQIDAERIRRWQRDLARHPVARWSIVGPEGTGKTVLLEDLAEGVESVEWLKIHGEDSLLQRARAGMKLFRRSRIPLFLDGAEVLPRIFLATRPLLRPKIVATLHRPRPSLDILFETRFDPGAVLDLVRSLTHANLSPNETERILQIGRKNHGNVRAILRQLYREAGEGRRI